MHTNLLRIIRITYTIYMYVLRLKHISAFNKFSLFTYVRTTKLILKQSFCTLLASVTYIRTYVHCDNFPYLNT